MVNQQPVGDDSVVLKNDQGEVLIKLQKKETCMAQSYFNVPVL